MSVSKHSNELDLHNVAQNNNELESVLHAGHILYSRVTQRERQEADVLTTNWTQGKILMGIKCTLLKRIVMRQRRP